MPKGVSYPLSTILSQGVNSIITVPYQHYRTLEIFRKKHLRLIRAGRKIISVRFGRSILIFIFNCIEMNLSSISICISSSTDLSVIVKRDARLVFTEESVCISGKLTVLLNLSGAQIVN